MYLTKFTTPSRRLPSFFNMVPRDVFDIFEETYLPTKLSVPMVNTSETDDEYLLEVLAPKIQANDLKIEVEDDIIYLSVEKEIKNEHDFVNRKEYSLSYSSRSFRLPDNIDVKNITAKNENGLIIIRIPKKEAQKSTRQVIEIQ